MQISQPGANEFVSHLVVPATTLQRDDGVKLWLVVPSCLPVLHDKMDFSDLALLT